MDAKIIPLAVTMMAGPQIISSIIFVTSERGPVKVSLSYIVAIAIAASAGILAAFGLAHLIDDLRDIGGSSGSTGFGKAAQFALVGLIAAFALRTYLRRAGSEPPKWLGALQSAGPGRAFVLGLMLIALMPGDIVVMLTVGIHLRSTGHSFAGALPMIATVTLIAALPLLAYLLLGSRARAAMPRVRDWMNSHSWLIDIVICGVYALLILSN
jgi:hypothetical protein